MKQGYPLILIKKSHFLHYEKSRCTYSASRPLLKYITLIGLMPASSTKHKSNLIRQFGVIFRTEPSTVC